MKSHYNMKQYILLVSGPLSSGKTTLVDAFLKNEDRLFRASFDSIKKLVSDFDGEKDRALVKDLLFSLSKEAFNKGLSVVVEGSASIFIEMRGFYKKLAEENSVVFTEINLEAPLDVLKERLKKRVAQGKALTVTSSEQLIYRYDLYFKHKDKNIVTYDTTKSTPEEIYLSVIKKLSNSN